MMILVLSLTLALMLLVGTAIGAHAPEPGAVSEVQRITEHVMALSLSRSEGVHAPSYGGKERYGITLKATKEYPAGAFPEEDLHPALKDAGWAIDYKYSADTPDGTVFAYRKNQVLCIYEISWSPGHVDYDGLTEQQEKESITCPAPTRLPSTLLMTKCCITADAGGAEAHGRKKACPQNRPYEMS